MLPTHLPTRPLLISFAAIVGLGIAGGIAGWIGPRPQPSRSEERRTENRTQSETSTSTEADARTRTLEQQVAQLTAQLQASTRTQADTNTRTVERIERYVPGPSSAPAPVVVVKDGSPSAAPMGVTAPQLAEVITRTIEAVDKSRTETESSSTTTAKAETKTETETAKTEKSETVASSETLTKTEEKVTVKPGEVPEFPRFGAGYTSARQPFASYDLAHGPKLFGLERVGAGVFVTKSGSGGIDGGPQANLVLSKGKRLQPFVMGGYAVRKQQTLIGVGVKF